MHFDGKNVTDVLFLSWILMGNKLLVTKVTTVYYYDTVKIVHLKIGSKYLRIRKIPRQIQTTEIVWRTNRKYE